MFPDLYRDWKGDPRAKQTSPVLSPHHTLLFPQKCHLCSVVLGSCALLICPHQVNLVSEHIWCQDFLVRSFYLKNLQTNETRTVTQFHFLSWYDQGVPSSTRSLLDFRR